MPASKKTGFTTFSSHERGFTLIELLVVISIIAILSVVGVVTFTGVQASARDAKRREDLQALQNAIRQYTLTNHAFPPSSCSTDNNGSWSAAFRAALEPNYIQGLPIDPLNGQAGRCFGATCVYCFTPNMWCGNPNTGPSCNVGVANLWTYQEKCSSNMIGDSARFNYGCNHFMKSIDAL